MVSVIHSSSSLRNVLNYNEQKVNEGVAECLEAAYYLKEADKLTFNQKLLRLKNQASLNTRTKVNTVHISLNFDPSESHNQDTLRAIAASYIEKIGFCGQPYLLYQHFDAGHPHVHIVTTNIRPDGSRIELHNLGSGASEKARKEIELDFNLVRAEDKIHRSMYDLNPINTKVQYGKAATKRAIVNVLNLVFKDYKFTSLAELNAVLNLYNVAAEQGNETSRIFKNDGLVYRVRNPDGTMQGLPIKASDFYNKPTLKKLEDMFSIHEKARLPYKNRIKNAIDLGLIGNPGKGLTSLIQELEGQGIDTVLRYTNEGKVFGITYIDHKNGCVFNGSALGKNYSAMAMLQRCGEEQQFTKGNKIPGLRPVFHPSLQASKQDSGHTPAPYNHQVPGTMESILNLLLHPEQDSSHMPYELSGRKKNKKKQKTNRI